MVCGERTTINGVALVCRKPETSKHRIHFDETRGVTWGGVSMARESRPTQQAQPICGKDGCNLHPKHKGPHGVQDTLL